HVHPGGRLGHGHGTDRRLVRRDLPVRGAAGLPVLPLHHPGPRHHRARHLRAPRHRRLSERLHSPQTAQAHAEARCRAVPLRCERSILMLLEVRGLGKQFGGLHAVKDVDLDVAEGQITAIIGPNGAGKSTFFNLLSGFYRPTSGSVAFRGEDITGRKPYRTVRDGIARTFQTTHLFEDSTVLDNVLSGRIVRSRATVFGAVFQTPWFRREELHNLEKAREALEFTG